METFHIRHSVLTKYEGTHGVRAENSRDGYEHNDTRTVVKQILRVTAESIQFFLFWVKVQFRGLPIFKIIWKLFQKAFHLPSFLWPPSTKGWCDFNALLRMEFFKVSTNKTSGTTAIYSTGKLRDRQLWTNQRQCRHTSQRVFVWERLCTSIVTSPFGHLTANRISSDCVQISLGPSIPNIPPGFYHTGGFDAMF